MCEPYSLNDQSNPDNGVVRTENTVGSGVASGTLYTVHPTSVGELNPTKSGAIRLYFFMPIFQLTPRHQGFRCTLRNIRSQQLIYTCVHVYHKKMLGMKK